MSTPTMLAAATTQPMLPVFDEAAPFDQPASPAVLEEYTESMREADRALCQAYLGQWIGTFGRGLSRAQQDARHTITRTDFEAAADRLAIPTGRPPAGLLTT